MPEQSTMMKDHLTIKGQDGAFGAYISRPRTLPAPAVVVLQELFGVNADIRKTCVEIARRLSAHTPEYLGYIKRLVGNAIDTHLAEGLALERNLFMKLCVSDQALARMRSYEEKKITDPSRSLEAQRRINGDRIEHDTYAGDRGNA